jgi:hypothetical protein
MVAIDGCVSRARLARQPLPPHRVARVLGRKGLQRDRAAQPRIFSLVHDSHAAAADFPDDPVRTNLGPRSGRGVAIERERRRDRPRGLLQELLVG